MSDPKSLEDKAVGEACERSRRWHHEMTRLAREGHAWARDYVEASHGPAYSLGIAEARAHERALAQLEEDERTVADKVIGATAALVGVTEQLERVAATVLDSRANVVGQLPVLVGPEEAAKLLGIEVEALRSRVKRGQIPESAIKRTGGKKGKRAVPQEGEARKRGGNAGRIQFWRDALINMTKGRK